MDQEQLQKAKDNLSKAIHEYYQAVDPQVFINAWVLVTHKMSQEHMEQNTSALSYLTPTEQHWPLTSGMLLAASDAARSLSA
jgi:hypothetical protein